MLGTFQPPVALPVAHLPPAGDFFLKHQFQQVLKRFALPMFDVSAPGTGHRFAPCRVRGPVALPSSAALIRPPGALENNLSAARKRPSAFGNVRPLGQGAARPRSVKRLRASGGGDPGSVDSLGRFLCKRAHKREKSDQADGNGKRPSNRAPPGAIITHSPGLFPQPLRKETTYKPDPSLCSE